MAWCPPLLAAAAGMVDVFVKKLIVPFRSNARNNARRVL
ncbi:hypothetical protein Z945_3763 [Sulfitobacter noctilucae]|nr:hypothetical protein Z945_3763 [Sulfitobacter noctilucae]